MVSRRTFIVWANPLFRDSVLALLQHPDVECVGAANDEEVSVEKILSAEPDTILVEETAGELSATLMALFNQPSFRGRLVSLNLSDNRLRVFEQEQQTALHAEDILELILQ